jgi:hypothetical protein
MSNFRSTRVKSTHASSRMQRISCVRVFSISRKELEFRDSFSSNQANQRQQLTGILSDPEPLRLVKRLFQRCFLLRGNGKNLFQSLTL